MSVQVKLRDLPLKCQYRLYSQVCRTSVSTGYAHRPATQLSIQVTLTGLPLNCQYRLNSYACCPSVRTVSTHTPASQVSVNVTLTGLPLNSQYRLHSQACRTSASIDYTRRPASQVSVQLALSGVLLNMSIDVTHTGLPRRPDPYQQVHWDPADRVVFLASKGTSERVQHSCRFQQIFGQFRFTTRTVLSSYIYIIYI